MQRTKKKKKKKKGGGKPYSTFAKSLPHGLSTPYPINPSQKENRTNREEKQVMKLCTYQFSINHHP